MDKNLVPELFEAYCILILHFSRANICSKTKKKIAGENECQISQNYILHIKFSEFFLCNHNSCEIWHLFSRTSMRNFLWCYYRWFITSLALEKCKKRMHAIFFKLFWYKILVYWKLKLLNFLMDSILISFMVKFCLLFYVNFLYS